MTRISQVELSEYNKQWPTKFETEKRQLLNLIGHFNIGSIEHVGSTAVIGLIAKPVIDIMFGVQSLADSKPAIDILVKNGYKYWPYKDDVMHWFCKPSDKFRTHHLHLIPFNSTLWKERIQFRDMLRNDEVLANEYATLKTQLAESYKNDREQYTVKKWPFIKKVLGK